MKDFLGIKDAFVGFFVQKIQQMRPYIPKNPSFLIQKKIKKNHNLPLSIVFKVEHSDFF
jgi:hypothetical protein